MTVKILADSTCDLSPELVRNYGISILPLHIILGEKEYRDGIDITPDEIYRWSDENKTTPKTSAPALPDAVALMKKCLGGEADQELVCFSISGEMSSSGNIMKMAAEELHAQDRVFVVDSRNLSTGIGLLVLEAACLAKQGLSAGEITEKIRALIPRVRASFVVDTLTYLHRGGRCGGLAAMMGGVLKLHPTIVVEDGKMHAAKKYRGHMDTVIKKYVKDMESAFSNVKKDRVFITHSGCSPELLKQIRKMLSADGVFSEILETRAGGVISSHCGPGTLGVLYIAGE